MYVGILALTVLLRWWHIGTNLPMASPSYIWFRYASLLASCLSVWPLYIFSKEISGKKQVGWLASWIFAISPWSIEQGRIASPMVWAIPGFLLLYAWWVRSKGMMTTVLMIFYVIVSASIVAWWQSDQGIPSVMTILKQWISFFSFQVFFISNPTFWWGGVRDMGILYISCAPIFLWGVYILLRKNTWHVFVWIVVISFIQSMSLTYPEGRQGVLLIPLLSLICALGIYDMKRRSVIAQGMVAMILISMLYEHMEWIHLYFVHLPRIVSAHMNDIYVPF